MPLAKESIKTLFVGEPLTKFNGNLVGNRLILTRIDRDDYLQHEKERLVEPVEAFLRRILLYVVIRADFKFVKAFMHGCYLQLDWNNLSFRVAAYNRSGSKYSARSFVRLDQFVISVSTHATFPLVYQPLPLQLKLTFFIFKSENHQSISLSKKKNTS